MAFQKNRLVKLAKARKVWIMTACSYMWVPLSLLLVFVGYLPWDSPFLIGYDTAQEILAGSVIAFMMMVNILFTLIALVNVTTLIRYRAEFSRKQYVICMFINLYPVFLTISIYTIALR